MKAFVTGSTGLLGSNLVYQLEEAGYEVVALVRSAEKGQRFLGHTSAKLVEGDMLNISAFTQQLAGCDVLFHTAAYFKEYTGADDNGEEMLQKINVDGSIALFDAAKAHGVSNIIYVSSSGVIGRPANGKLSDETTPLNEDSANRYFQSKIRAEKAIATWQTRNPAMRLVQILPVAILGPGDNGPTGLGRMVIDTLKGEIPAIPPGGFTLVDVRDVADSMVRAVEKGANGERYIIADGYMPLSKLVPLIAKTGGAKVPSVNMPYPLAWMYGAGSELVAKLTGNPPLATRVMIKTLNERTDLSSAKAQRELGVTFRPITETVADSIAWFRENSYV